MVPQRFRYLIASKTLKETDLKLTQLSSNINIEIDAADSEETDGASSKSGKVATMNAKAARGYLLAFV